MLRIAICDDNPEFLTQISNMITLWKTDIPHTICKTFSDADTLIQSHRSTPFDIIILDVLMPMLNGIDAATEIRNFDKKTKIIFLTSSSEYAVESYSVKAYNYLLKPICESALFSCLSELAAELSQNAHTITIKGLYAMHKIALDEIMYVEAQNKHIVFTLSNGTTLETTEPLHTYQDVLTLDDGFFRCHRSYIVNIYHIDTYTLKEIKISSGYSIPISRNCQRSFETAYFNTMFGKAGKIK